MADDIFVDSDKEIEKKHDVTFVIRGSKYAVKARKYGQELAQQLSFPDYHQKMIATAIWELCCHIIDHAGKGKISIGLVQSRNGRGIFIEAKDKGEALDEPKTLKLGGYPSGESLGLGLEGMKRFMDEFEIVTDPVDGTAVTMSKWTERVTQHS